MQIDKDIHFGFQSFVTKVANKQWRRQASEFGEEFEGQTRILGGGGKIEFLKWYFYLPTPLS